MAHSLIQMTPSFLLHGCQCIGQHIKQPERVAFFSIVEAEKNQEPQQESVAARGLFSD